MQKTTVLSSILIFVLGISLGIYFVYALPESTVTISRGIFPQGSYTIWSESGTYYSKNSYGLIPSWATSGTTNCTYLVEQANADLASEGGSIVFAGESATFNFPQGFNLSAKVSLIGQSRQRMPRLNFIQTDGSDCITIIGSHSGTIEACTLLENLEVYGGAGTTGNGIVLVPMIFSVTIRDVCSNYHGGAGLVIESYDVLVEGSRFNNNSRGIVLKQTGGSVTGELIFVNVSTKNNANEGVLMEDYAVSNVVFIGGSHETNGGYGGRFRGSPVNLYAVKFEANTLDQCFWSAYGVIEGCMFQLAPSNKYGIYFSSARETHFMANRFSGNWKDIMIDSGCRKLYIDSQISWNDSKIDVDSKAYDCDVWHLNDLRNQTTDVNGEVLLDFNFAYTVIPSINVVLEDNKFWYAETWYTDDNSRYNGTKLQICDADGTPASSGLTVHAFVRVQ